MRILIIGGGAAGTAAATRLRRLNENDEIIIFEKNSEFAVSNCGLNYYLSEEVKKDSLIGSTTDAMKQLYNIEVRLNSEVTSINRKDKTISIANKSNEYYDKLIVAIGAAQLRPDIEGVLSDTVFTISDLASVERIKDYIKYNEVKRTIIVGGGYIGTETAESLHALGIEVSIVEASNHILPMIDYDMAVTLQNHMREKGITLFLNETVNSFDEKRVTLSTGRTLEYDMAIIATGVKPNLKLTVLADLEIGESGGLIVNEHMQTSDKNIFAAGDDVEVIDFVTRKPVRLAQAGLAVKQAQVIADTLGGVDSEFKYALNTAITKAFDYTAAAVGANEKNLKDNDIEYYKVLMYGASHASYLPGNEMILMKLLFNKEGRILGAQGIGKKGIAKRLDVISMAMKMEAKVQDLQDIELCYAPAYSSGKDLINSLGSMAVNVLQKRVKFVSYEDIDWNNLTDEQMIIDVRQHPAFLEGHLPNAVNIPVEAIRNNLDSIPHEKMVVLYCNRGYKAYIASCILANRGFDNIYLLNGSELLFNEITKDKIAETAVQNFQQNAV